MSSDDKWLCCDPSTFAVCSVLEVLGKGKHSKVYKARQKKTILYYAIKSVDISLKDRVLQEVCLGALALLWPPPAVVIVQKLAEYTGMIGFSGPASMCRSRPCTPCNTVTYCDTINGAYDVYLMLSQSTCCVSLTSEACFACCDGNDTG